MTFRWLHLSDLHFREDERWDRRATLQALIAKAGELKAKGLAPDLVFVTGDIAWSGKPKEYEQATRFFHELNKVLALDPKDRWFLVPGNHDVDRSRIKAAHRAITASLQDEATVEELLLHDPDSLRSLSTRLEAYYAFAGDFLGAARALQTDRPWRTDVREFDGVSIGILQLNSAWISAGGEADNANLLVGEAQVREALDATPDAFIRIALMHHPMRNLREFDANRVESILGAKGGAAFLLRGHLHLNRTKIQYSPDGQVLEIAAGTLYTDEASWPRGFHLGEVDLGKGETRIHLFRYSGEASGFFAPDNLTYVNAPDGVCKIKLPKAFRLGVKEATAVNAVSEDQRISFTARYRAAAANYHGHARFIGFPNQATRPNARVSDLFVPLRMKWREPAFIRSQPESCTTAWIANYLLGPPIRHHGRRVVVLGDPGSGKTTLSRFMVMLAA
ncbi:MAG TPA: metallophosphoesterase, partial [Thermoanaerobaculia bacterium]|nr:metallophosphoesterase [Thermoanaerobaculia bacterium]